MTFKCDWSTDWWFKSLPSRFSSLFTTEVSSCLLVMHYSARFILPLLLKKTPEWLTPWRQSTICGQNTMASELTLIPKVLHSGGDNGLMKQANAFNHQKTEVTRVNILYHFALPWECFHGKQTQNKWKQKGYRAPDLPSILSQVKSLLIKNFTQTIQDHPDYIFWFTWSAWHHSKPLR